MRDEKGDHASPRIPDVRKIFTRWSAAHVCNLIRRWSHDAIFRASRRPLQRYIPRLFTGSPPFHQFALIEVRPSLW